MSYLRCEQTALSCGAPGLAMSAMQIAQFLHRSKRQRPGDPAVPSPPAPLTPSHRTPPSAEVDQGCEQTPLFSSCFILTPTLQMKEVDGTQVDAWLGAGHVVLLAVAANSSPEVTCCALQNPHPSRRGKGAELRQWCGSPGPAPALGSGL